MLLTLRPPGATDFAADLVVTAAALVLAFPSPPEGFIVLCEGCSPIHQAAILAVCLVSFGVI